MLSVQEVGTEILGGNPRKFYILGGTEYGVKQKYIDILENYYGNKIESPTVHEILNMMSKKHIIPLQPAVYIVRYDETFISSLSDSTEKKIKNTNIVGTIVCLYEQTKHISKANKYLPDYTASIDAVSTHFIKKYLRSDFPTISDKLIDIVVNSCDNYSRAKNMCRCIDAIPSEKFFSLSNQDIPKLFGCYDTSTESQVRVGIASRRFNYLVELSEKYEEDSDMILYIILQTMIELDKVMSSPYTESDVRQYIKLWTREDIYYMFMNTYEELNKLRSMSSYDIHNSLIYLFGLLKFTRIPSPEVMSN